MAKKSNENTEFKDGSGLPETSGENSGTHNPAAEHEAVKNEAAPEKRKKKIIVSGAEFWRFAPETENGEFDGVEFIGKYCGEVKREKDGKDADKNPNEKAGSTIGYDFEQERTGLHFIIGNSHAIEKLLEKTGHNPDLLYCIEFLGKGQTANNKPYNRFECSILE